MKQYRDWYFKYWKAEDRVDPHGRVKHTLFYDGPFYLLPEKLRRFKLLCISAIVIYAACAIGLMFFPFDIQRNSQVASLSLLHIIPLLCAICAVPALITARREMTFRRYHRVIVRLRWACGFAFAIFILQLIFETIYLIQFGFTSSADIFFFVLLCFTTVFTVIVCIYFLKMQFPTIFPGDDAKIPIPDDE